MKSILSHYTLYAGSVYKLHCFKIDNDIVSIEPYGCETASTEFHNGIVAITNATILSHIDDIKCILRDSSDLDIRAQRIFTFISDNELWSNNNHHNFTILSIDALNVKVLS